jgi:hypothetical protein
MLVVEEVVEILEVELLLVDLGVLVEEHLVFRVDMRLVEQQILVVEVVAHLEFQLAIMVVPVVPVSSLSLTHHNK